MSRRAISLGLVLIALVLFLVGCGGSGPKRYAISGNVTLKGSPVEEGIIYFEPLTGGTMDGSIILKGKYSIPRDKGLAVGKYQVRIYAGDGTSGEGKGGYTVSVDPLPKRGSKGAGIERIPPEYNTKSTLVREVTSSGSNKFDFDIR